MIWPANSYWLFIKVAFALISILLHFIFTNSLEYLTLKFTNCKDYFN